MKKLISLSLFAAVGLSAIGCSFYARSPDDYRDATKKVLDTKSDSIKSCYDAALKSQPAAQGTVTVRFLVEHESGKVMNPKLDAAKTTAPEPVSKCVLDSLNGVVLTPPDARDGDATFVWQFQVPSGPAS